MSKCAWGPVFSLRGLSSLFLFRSLLFSLWLHEFYIPVASAALRALINHECSARKNVLLWQSSDLCGDVAVTLRTQVCQTQIPSRRRDANLFVCTYVLKFEASFIGLIYYPILFENRKAEVMFTQTCVGSTLNLVVCAQNPGEASIILSFLQQHHRTCIYVLFDF